MDSGAGGRSGAGGDSYHSEPLVGVQHGGMASYSSAVNQGNINVNNFFLYGGWVSVPPSIFYSEIQCIIIIRIIIRIT